ncbi:TrbM/KikA/MpfK family conjugal transfer protein [Paraburkholderia flagellata]|uniref:TrbM/KikA/MpfK family conjugal transfer protein n=1 Tax=Paraburkholderia flagellata TaxID=2883241 RepID=UPI001EEF2222|nr:TrbM/KikA/MpfK family conjugal transfer protein [Paraburkholderia flagellata]
MKRVIATLVIAASGIVVDTSAHASDACQTILCLAGMLSGSGGGSSCDSAVADYFNIVPTRHGHPDLSAMPKQRLAFLNQCTSDVGTWKTDINNAYGQTY